MPCTGSQQVCPCWAVPDHHVLLGARQPGAGGRGFRLPIWARRASSVCRSETPHPALRASPNRPGIWRPFAATRAQNPGSSPGRSEGRPPGPCEGLPGHDGPLGAGARPGGPCGRGGGSWGTLVMLWTTDSVVDHQMPARPRSSGLCSTDYVLHGGLRRLSASSPERLLAPPNGGSGRRTSGRGGYLNGQVRGGCGHLCAGL